jgi:uncharacterized membrane protein YuzA (DUF378 family)
MDFPDFNAQSVSWIVADVGALNWGLREATGTNLVTEAVGTGSAGAVYLLVGVAGAAALADTFGFLELEEVGL